MTSTYGALLRGSDILYQFNYITKFPSLTYMLNGFTELNTPGTLHPIIMDNGNVKSGFDLNIYLKDASDYNPNAIKGTTGNVFEQFFDLKRVIEELGIFISGNVPAVETGTSSTQRYSSGSSVSTTFLNIYMDVGNGDQAFSNNYDIYDDDYILSTRTGITFNAIPTKVSLENMNIAHTAATATVHFSRVRLMLPFRTTN